MNTDMKRSIEDLIKKSGDGRTAFSEHEVKGLLSDLGLRVPRGSYLGADKISAPRPDLSSLRALGYPVIAKVSSTKITSKSDVHGLRGPINNDDELDKAVVELAGIEDAEGVLVEEMEPAGTEVIVGGVVDRQFGPVVMFGIGGIFVELFKDVSFGLAPMTSPEALRLVREVKGYRLLEGLRGRPPADLDALSEVIVCVSRLMATGLIEEIDLNPVSVYPKGAIVLDAKMSLRKP